MSRSFLYSPSYNLSALRQQVREAIKAFDRAIEINPQYAVACYNRGMALQKLGRIAESNAALAKAEELGYTG